MNELRVAEMPSGSAWSVQPTEERVMDVVEQMLAKVRATYENSMILFDLPPATTLEQLAAMLTKAGRGHGSPITIEIVIEPAVAAD